MRFLFLISLLSVFAFFSCGRPDYPSQLVTIDSLSEIRPDSARLLLRHVDSRSAGFDDDAQWYYRLLQMKVRVKSYGMFGAADKAKAAAVLEHYRHGGDRHLLPEAYYYAGCVARDNGNAPMAIDFFQQAMASLPDTTDLKMRSILNFQTGFLLLYQGVYDPAIDYFRESLRLEQLRKDTAMVAFCFEKLAYTYRDKGVNDSALFYFEKAHQCAKAMGDFVYDSFHVYCLGNVLLS